MIITTRPEEVLDHHAKLTAMMKNPSPLLATYMTNYMRNAMQRGGRDVGASMFFPVVTRDTPFITKLDGIKMANVLAMDLTDAITYEVTEEMTGIMRAVHDKAAPTEVLEQAELPAESGFAWLDDGWDIRDWHGELYVIRAVSWHFMTVQSDGTVTRQFADMTNWPSVRLCLWVHPTDDPPQFRNAMNKADLGSLQALHTGIIPLGLPLDTLPEERNAAESFLGLIHLLWMFLGMEIVSTHQPRVKNYYRKHALKSLLHGEVHVVTLRRVRYVTEHGEQDAAHIDWSCRWPVQGHYRHLSNPNAVPGTPVHRYVPIGPDKLCAVCGGDGTWVRPYLKGPDGLPLKVSKTLMKLAR